ncbi:MAG TPA: hypothetical protein VMG36_04950 [Thermoplasmata archaeon]|nr:hypothetical protein [Thermoplasmata archaeon]
MPRDRHPDRAAGRARPHGAHRAVARPAVPRTRHATETTYSHVRVELDLQHELPAASRLPFLDELGAILRERRIEDRDSLLELAGALLSALGTRGFGRVDHWEIDPGGWLPLPDLALSGAGEPVDHLLRVLRSDRFQELAGALGFLVRLSGDGDWRADVILRRIHRERDHTLSIDLWGRFDAHATHQVITALKERLQVLRVQITETTARD